MGGTIAPPEAHWPENVSALLDRVERTLIADGVASKLAKVKAEKIVYDICEEIGGIQFYLPKSNSIKIHQRNEQIYSEFNGFNHKQLAQKYDLTEQGIYKIIKEHRARDIANRQTQLF